MSPHKANNLSDPLVILKSNDFELHRAKGRSAWESFFDESDSEDEEEMLRTAYPITDSLVKVPISKFRYNNKECHVITKLQKDQLLNVCCTHCACCKKIKEFLECLPTTKSAASHDNGFGRSSRHRRKRFKKTLSTPKSSLKVSSLDKNSALNLPNYTEKSTVKTTYRSTGKIENEVPLSDMSTDEYTSEQNCAARNTELSKINDKHSNTINNLPNVQNDPLTSENLENERNGSEKEIKTRRNFFLRRNGTEPNQNLNNTVHSPKGHSNGVSEKTGNSSNSSDSDLSFDEYTSGKYCAVRKSMSDIHNTNDQNAGSKSILPSIQNDERENYMNGGIKNIVNQAKKIKVQKQKVEPPKNVKTINNVHPPKSDSNDSSENRTDSHDSSENTESNTVQSYAKPSSVEKENKHRTPPPNKHQKGLPMQQTHSLAETDPFNLKCEKRTTRSSRNNTLVTPLLKIPVDTTTNRNFSKAVVRKLGRTGGISFDMESRKTANGSCKSFHAQKSRTLYSSDEWLNSEGFLKLSGDEY